MRHLALVLALASFGASCKRKPAPASAPASPTAADQARTQALGLLAAWTEAQNRGDLKAYLDCYEPRSFTGVKRALASTLRRYDFRGWQRDRAQLLAKHPVVVVERPVVETWLDRGATLKAGVSKITFTQRWKSERYADHGLKVLLVWRDAQGRARIVYEDMLSSLPGFGEDAATFTPVPLGPLADDAAALGAWRRIAPTGATYQAVLAWLPKDPKITRPLARALLAGGQLECRDFTETEECGETIRAWNLLSPSADFDDPCLRRKLGAWALTGAGLLPDDVAKLEDRLVELARLDDPETELNAAARDQLRSLGPARRFALVEKLMAADVSDLAETLTQDLPDPYLLQALARFHFPSALLSLDAAKHPTEVARGWREVRLDEEGELSFIRGLPSARSKPIDEVLIENAERGSCPIAMAAAEKLSEHGINNYLPARPRAPQSLDDEAQALGQALCRARYDEARWAQLASEVMSARVTVTETHVERNDPPGEQDDDEQPDEAPVVSTVAGPDISPFSETIYLDGCRAEKDGSASCSFSDSDADHQRDDPTHRSREIIFKRGKDGRLRVREIKLTEEHNSHWTCGC